MQARLDYPGIFAVSNRRHTDGNQSHAAAILGITRGCLRNKVRQLNISISRTVAVREPQPQPEKAILLLILLSA